MARRYEYVIHGPPAAAENPSTSPKKTLSVRKDQRRKSNLRTLYRDSGDTIVPLENDEQTETVPEHRVSSPTTPRLPPTPPAAEEEEQSHENPPEQADSIAHSDASKLRSIAVTPVNGNNPPTPDDTPPREQLKPPARPFLNLRPSMASTRAESFRTAREQIHSDDDSVHASPEFSPSSGLVPPLPELPPLSAVLEDKDLGIHTEVLNRGELEEAIGVRLPSSPLLPAAEEHLHRKSIEGAHGALETQFIFDDIPTKEEPLTLEDEPIEQQAEPSVHAQVTDTPDIAPAREPSLRDRLAKTHKLQTSASTEAFANVIGWNDGVLSDHIPEEPTKNRWSGNSNLSAVEAYVVDSPIKPKKRGTLRKVIKNDSLRSVSSPVPKSNRTSLQSTSDSPHRLVHKTQKLGNQNRWSTGSDISKRSLSWGSTPAFPKQEVIKVAVIPERQSSLNTSASSSRRHSRSVSANSGMPPVSSIGPRRKRAFSDSQQQNVSQGGMPQIPLRSSSLSAPTSRSGSRANSIASHQVSFQREQAEKDLRTTLDRMESERLSASLRRGSDQSAPSTSPAVGLTNGTPQRKIRDVHNEDMERLSDYTEKPKLTQRPYSIDLVNITPGTKEWADLRPSELVGTPFSQASALSTSPEIIEARIINFFPHNNDSVQLIEPNRLSETPAVKALKAQDIRRANTVPERQVKITTPKQNNQVVPNEEWSLSSPLRNPRKPPEPPQVQFAVIPPTPKSELNNQLGLARDTNHGATQSEKQGQRRPQLQTNERSESFIRTLSRGLSLRNAKNLKADQQLDSTLHPFWRPRAFWDDDEQKRRSQADKDVDLRPVSAVEGASDVAITRSVAILDPTQPLIRSNSIATGPMSLVRRMSERRKQRRIVDDHLAQQQALVKQTSYSSLHRIRAGHRLFGLQPLRSLSLNTKNINLTRLNSLRDRVSTAKARRENDKRELRREKLRKSIGAEVVSQSDSRFPAVDIGSPMKIEHLGGRKVDDEDIINEMLENARAENVVEKRGLRM